MSRLPADDPSHRGIMAQSLGVVDILVSRKPPEHRLPQHAEQGMPAVFACAGVGEPLAGQIRKAECVVEFAVGKQAGIRGDNRTTKLEGQWRSKSSLNASPFNYPPGSYASASK